jgi:hypothetical protein
LEEERPLLAFGLSLAAGVLIIVDGFFLSIASGVAYDIGYGAAGGVLAGLGLLGVLLGLIVVLFAGLLYRSPEHHTGYGIVILVLSLVSVVVGGGFLIGIPIGVVGGIFAMTFEEVDDIEPVFDFQRGRANDPFAGPKEARRAAPQLCPNCRALVFAGSERCPNCETPISSPSPASPPRSPRVASRVPPPAP